MTKKMGLISFSILVFILVGVAFAGGLEARVYLPLVQVALPTPTPTLTATPTKTPTPTATIPIPTVTPTNSPTSAPPNIQIIDVQPTGSEYVEIQNQGAQAVQLLNWTLRDQANHVFTFPAFLIQPGQKCRIYTDETHPDTCGFNYGSGSSIWNNDGDCAFLRDQQDQPIDTFCY